jgi:uncharacterized protein (DUF305 family)
VLGAERLRWHDDPPSKRTAMLVRSRIPLVLGSLVLIAGAACAAIPPAPPAGDRVALTPTTPRAHPADVRFIHSMIHHHSQALVMAELASRFAVNPGLRTLAERIQVSQTDEIALMQLWLTDVGEPVPEPDSRIAATVHDHHPVMSGMLTPEQLDRLAAARDEEFDRLFLTLMIQHHEGALDMVEALFATDGGAVDDFIYKIASDTFADQGSEIDRMQRLLGSLTAGR